MNAEMRQAVELVSIRILEEAAFLFAGPMDAETARPTAGWNACGVKLSWSGPNSGTMRAWMEPGLLPILAANMLGLEEDDPEAARKGLDALGEILNMVVGNCLTEAWGPGPVFHLDTPAPVAAELVDSDLDDGFWIVAEDRIVLFWVGGVE